MTNQTYLSSIALMLICLSFPLSGQTLASSLVANSLVELNTSLDRTKTIKQLIAQAITKFEQTDRKHWAYQVTRYENEEGTITSSIEQFTPEKDLSKQWTLIQINGKTPSQKQTNEFISAKLKTSRNNKDGDNFSVALRELINIDSLDFLSENASYIQMSFDVYFSKLGKNAKGKLTGTLSYNKSLAFIETITIVNNAEFSPLFSANITDFKLTFSFININDSILPVQQQMDMKGSFAFFTEIDETSTDTFSSYRLLKP